MKSIAVILLAAACAVAQTKPATSSGSSSRPAPNPGTQAKPAAPAKPAPPVTPEPDDGSVQGNTYTSDYFHFHYQFPEHLEVEKDFMQGQEDESKQSFVLLAAYGPSAEGNRHEGVVVFADRMVALPAGSGDGNWLPGYVEHLQNMLAKQGAEPVGSTREYNFAGLKFLRADFQRGGENPAFQSVLVTAQRQRSYALVFQFISSTESQTNQLIESMNSLTFTAGKNSPKN